MLSTIIGLLLVALGIVCYAVALIVYFRKETAALTKGLHTFTDKDLEAIAKVLENLAKVLEQFGKLSETIQLALLGSLNIGVGVYLLATKLF
jgi:predicted PurR-regulated permease PerM